MSAGAGALAHMLDVSGGSDAAFVLSVNGVVRSREAGGSPAAQTIFIQQDLWPGRNVLEASVAPAGEDPGAPMRPRPDVALADLRFAWRVRGDELRRGVAVPHVLGEEEWTAEPGAALPHRLMLIFDVHGDFDPPIWTRARPASADAMRGRVVQEVRRLGGLLALGRVDMFTDAMTLRYRDIARALPNGIDAASMRDIDALELDKLVSTPGFRLEPFDESATRCEAQADGRLIACTRADGSALLRVHADGEPIIDLPLTFAVLDGALVVVR